MRLSFSAVFGTSYATTTGDLSQANFVSSRMGQIEEREWYMAVQEFMIRHWKKPGFDEELYRSMLAGKVRLPIAKFDKFNRPDFTGRRWKFVQPVDDMTANEKKVNLRIASVGDIIRETSQENPRTVWKRIAKDEAAMKALGIERIIFGRILASDQRRNNHRARPTRLGPADAGQFTSLNGRTTVASSRNSQSLRDSQN
jgi:capsid protein